jgi:hypothetical protein
MNYDSLSFELMRQFHDHLYWYIQGFFLLMLVISVLYRIQKGKPLHHRNPDESLFAERLVSGTSFRTWFSRIGGARRSLVVALTPEHLIVRPIFPFTLLFIPELFGLENTIPLTHLREVKDSRLWGRDGVEITFENTGGAPERLWLRLRRREAFYHALHASLA